MKISSTTYNNFSFNSKSNADSITISKREYVNSKTKNLDSICDVMCLGALATGLLNTDETGKLLKPSKWCKGLVISAAVLFAIKCIKQITLSKEYEKEIHQ